MAGRFVSIEDAARLLGVGVDEVKRLVERKKLFPLRDGKFKVEEIERVRATIGDESSQSGSLALDLDGGDLALEEPAGLGDSRSADAGSQTIVRGGAPGGGADDALAFPMGGDGEDDDTAVDGGDLVLEANPGASSPSLARPPAASGSLVGSFTADDPLNLDISNISIGAVAGGPAGSQATGGLSGGPAAAGSGAGFSLPADSGLSLEEGGLGVSGIDLDPGIAAASGVDLVGGSLAGDEFNLGGGAGDEDSASVVIATDESGDSSFFANVADDSASVALDSSVIGDSSEGIAPEMIPEAFIDMRFSGWQIAGLTCCALILLTGGLVMYDLLSEIHKPQGAPVSGLLLNAFGHLLGWRR